MTAAHEAPARQDTCRAVRPVRWQARAACRGADREQFFPHVPAGASFRVVTEHVAWRYCHGCPVRVACDDYADRNRELGLWAGAWGRFRGSQYVRTPVIPAVREVAS